MSTSYALTLIARFFAGVAAGAAWGMIAGYARRIVPDTLKGRTLAVAMVGTPVALTFGVPVGTLLGDLIGWRAVFRLMSCLTLILIIWGLTFGGAATQLQTAFANASGEDGVDVVMPINTTVWNSAIAGGGIVGGALLEIIGVQSFPVVLLMLLLVALIITWVAKRHGFPQK